MKKWWLVGGILAFLMTILILSVIIVIMCNDANSNQDQKLNTGKNTSKESSIEKVALQKETTCAVDEQTEFTDESIVKNQQAADSAEVSTEEMLEIAQEMEPVEEYFRRLEKENENITFDEESGVIFMNNELLILTENGVEREDLESYLSGYGGKIVDCLNTVKYYRVAFDKNYTLEEIENIALQMENSIYVKRAVINPIMNNEGAEFKGENAVYPSDYWNGADWDIDNPEGENWSLEAIKAPYAWQYLSEMSGVRIGIIDSFVTTEHEDLKAKTWMYNAEGDQMVEYYFNPMEKECILMYEDGTQINADSQYDYVVSNAEHGTHVAGIIGAEWNDIGISGVLGDKAELLCVRYLQKNTASHAYSVIKGIDKLLCEGAKVINISMGSGDEIPFAASMGNEKALNYLQKQADTMEIWLQKAIKNNVDFLLCVCAGNATGETFIKLDDAEYGYVKIDYDGGIDWFHKIFMQKTGNVYAKYGHALSMIDDPDVVERIIVVGASNKESKCSYFSNTGERVDILAPGEDIYSTVPNGYLKLPGTSMSTPFVTAACGMAYSLNPHLTAPEVKELVCSSISEEIQFKESREGVGLLDLSQVTQKAIASRGENAGLVNETKYNADGKVVLDSVAEYQNGNLIKKTTREYERIAVEYDAQGKYTINMYVDERADVCIDEYTYDSEGRKTSWYLKRDDDIVASYNYAYTENYAYEMTTYEDTKKNEYFKMIVYDKRDKKYEGGIDGFFYECNPTLSEYEVLCDKVLEAYEKDRWRSNIELKVGVEGERVYGDNGIFLEYDEQGRVKAVNMTGYYLVYQYDVEGKLISILEYDCGEYCGVQVFEYDDQGRLIKKLEYSGDSKELEYWTEYSYDAKNN